MSPEVPSRRRKINSESTPAPDGDHRKRRRNRTTQSCLNCHTSKRMCDRKRPACARCTQLGLTGLCVYEVDDPSQRTDTQDESSRLLKRVAELEGVIRELKNKPHPRWSQPTNSSEEYEKWHSRPQILGNIEESSSSNVPSPPGRSSSSSDKGDTQNVNSVHAALFNGTPSIHLQIPTEPRRMSSASPYSPSSPLNGSSPGLMTPTDEYSFSPAGVASHTSLQDYDLASMFMNYPGIMGSSDHAFSPLQEQRCNKQASHCGCIFDSTNYSNMLELSLRLRKASDILSRSATHQLGSFCPLQQRISELDSFTTNLLSDIETSDRVNSAIQTFPASQIFPQRMAGGSPRGPTPNRTWESIPTQSSSSPTALDDSFMTWEPPRRP